METVFKADRCEGKGGPYLSDKSVPPPASLEGGDRWIILGTVFKVEEGAGGGERICQTKVVPPASLEGGDRQTILKQRI